MFTKLCLSSSEEILYFQLSQENVGQSSRGFVLVMKWFSLSQIFCYSDEHLKRNDIFNPLSHQIQGWRSRASRWTVCTRTSRPRAWTARPRPPGLSRRPWGRSRRSGAGTADPRDTRRRNWKQMRWMNENLMSAWCFVKGLIIPVDKLIKSDNEG